jgi:hypothetical protein
MRQTVGLGVQLEVAQRMLAVHRRHRLGMRRCLLLENPVHGQGLRVFACGGVEVVEQALTLRLGENGTRSSTVCSSLTIAASRRCK